MKKIIFILFIITVGITGWFYFNQSVEVPSPEASTEPISSSETTPVTHAESSPTPPVEASPAPVASSTPDFKTSFDQSLQKTKDEAEQCQKDYENIFRLYEGRNKQAGQLDYTPQDLNEVLGVLRNRSTHSYARKQTYNLLLQQNNLDNETAGKTLQQLSEVSLCNPVKKNILLMSLASKLKQPEFRESAPQIRNALRNYLEAELDSTPGFGEFSMQFEMMRALSKQGLFPNEFKKSLDDMDKTYRKQQVELIKSAGEKMRAFKNPQAPTAEELAGMKDHFLQQSQIGQNFSKTLIDSMRKSWPSQSEK